MAGTTRVVGVLTAERRRYYVMIVAVAAQLPYAVGVLARGRAYGCTSSPPAE